MRERPHSDASTPAQTKATMAVGFRPNLSNTYIMTRLAHGTASVMPNVYVRDLVMVKPWLAKIFGSQVPRPIVTQKNELKQIIAAMIRTG